MDETESLDALANILTAVAERPYDISLHAQHVNLAQSLEGMETEAQSAMEMMTQLVAAGDDVWIPLLNSKEQSVDLETEGGVQELLELYSRAEGDYLCAYQYFTLPIQCSADTKQFQYCRSILTSSWNDTVSMFLENNCDPRHLEMSLRPPGHETPSTKLCKKGWDTSLRYP
jgi:hypothetical protein